MKTKKETLPITAFRNDVLRNRMRTCPPHVCSARHAPRAYARFALHTVATHSCCRNASAAERKSYAVRSPGFRLIHIMASQNASPSPGFAITRQRILSRRKKQNSKNETLTVDAVRSKHCKREPPLPGQQRSSRSSVEPLFWMRAGIDRIEIAEELLIII